jgi:hypothetical protein
MKEIDFLPEWYKSKRRRILTYRAQYAALICIFAMMVGWSFFTARSVSTAQALVDNQELSGPQKQALEECARIQAQLAQLNKEAEMLKKVDSKIVISNVIAELSYLVDSSIVLTQADIRAEKFDANAQTNVAGAGTVRVAKSISGSPADLTGRDIRFRVVLQGLAYEASDVAALICKLEESPYFCQVIPGFSRTNKIKDRQVSEFEIGCYIANYRGAKQ